MPCSRSPASARRCARRPPTRRSPAPAGSPPGGSSMPSGSSRGRCAASPERWRRWTPARLGRQRVRVPDRCAGGGRAGRRRPAVRGDAGGRADRGDDGAQRRRPVSGVQAGGGLRDPGPGHDPAAPGPALEDRRAGGARMSSGVMYYLTTVLVYAGVDIMACIALNLQFGVAGLVNFGFILFQAAGAYAAAVLSMPPESANGGFQQYVLGLRLPFPLPWLGGAAAGGLLAVPIGLVVLRRLRSDYQAIALLVISVIANTLLTHG